MPIITPTSAKEWRELKKQARQQFDGSLDLFECCWREVREMADFYTFDDLMLQLDAAASARVNDPDSDFYMHG